MKNKRLWMTASLVCILLGAVLTAAGRLMGGQPGFYIDSNGVHAAGHVSKTEPLQASINLDEFDSMEIHADYADVELNYSDEFAIEYRIIGAYGDPVCEVKNNRLTFQRTKPLKHYHVGFFTGFMDAAFSEPDYYIRVTIPKDTKLSEAVFDIESGNLDISSIQADTLKIGDDYGDVSIGQYDGKSLDISLESGSLSLGTINAAQTVLKSDYGRIDLSKATGDSLLIQLESGDLQAERIDYSDTEITDDYGKVYITDALGGCFTAKMESGDCQIDRLDYSDTEITSSYGDVSLGLSDKIENYGYNLKTEYGTIRLDNKNEGFDSAGGEAAYEAAGDSEKMITIHCESGDIKLDSLK